MLLFNVILTCLVVWIAMYVNARYLSPAMLNRKRFKLFALRDDLALLVMKKVIEPDSQAYLMMLKHLNRSIRVLGSFSIVALIRHLMRLERDAATKKEIDTIMYLLKNSDDAYKNIVSQYFFVLHELFIERTKLFRKMFYPIFFFMKPVQDRKAQLDQIDSSISARQQEVALNAHAC